MSGQWVRPFLIAVTALAVEAAPALASLDPDKAISQFSLTTWQTANGLPQNAVTALGQTPDGYLWIGTQEGLQRHGLIAKPVVHRIDDAHSTGAQLADDRESIGPRKLAVGL